MYSHLFTKAYDDLSKAGKLTEAEIAAGHFTSLDEYFAHMADLIGININYIMLPLDEGTEGLFKIDANSRTITIPAQFNKCAAVQSDEMCEIAVFTIDRYYDFQDLDRASICVQWVNAANEEGISHIQLKDLETFPGKLRFGWPLTSAITKTPGPVHFAVRFFKESSEGGDKKYNYLLNTLTSTITVRPGLSIENPKIEEDNVSGLFASFVSNSLNPSYPQPLSPAFVAPGQDLIADGQTKPGYGAIDEDTNSLSMTAQAVANDLGIINYKWMFIPAGGNGVAEPLETDIVDEEGNVSETTVKDGYSINHNDWLKLDPQPTEREGSQKYYTQVLNENGEVVGHKLYTGNKFPAEDENGTPVDLYIVRTTLTILPSEDENIVGEYYVTATNTLAEINVSTPAASSKCVVPAPDKIEIVEGKDLPNHIFTNKDTKTVTLGVEIVKDDALPKYAYQWSSTENDPEGDLAKLLDIEDGVEKTYVVREPGWYSVHIDSILNRKKEKIDSNICKVTHLPEKPQITAMYYAILGNEATTEDIQNVIDGIDEWKRVDYEANLGLEVTLGSQVLLRIDTDLDSLNPLYSESLTYNWMVQAPNEAARPLDEKDVDIEGIVHQDFGLGKKVLVVRSNANTPNLSFHCEITNKIQDKTATVDTSDTYTFTLV